jgi:hypothetical protein
MLENTTSTPKDGSLIKGRLLPSLFPFIHEFPAIARTYHTGKNLG